MNLSLRINLGGASGIHPVSSDYFILMDGTQSMTLATSVSSDDITISMFTQGGITQELLNGYSINVSNVFVTPAEVTDIFVDGISVGVGGNAPTDGQIHTIRFINSSAVNISSIGSNFVGAILSVTISDALSWIINSQNTDLEPSNEFPTDTTKDLILNNVVALDWNRFIPLQIEDEYALDGNNEQIYVLEH